MSTVNDRDSGPLVEGGRSSKVAHDRSGQIRLLPLVSIVDESSSVASCQNFIVLSTKTHDILSQSQRA